MAPGQGARARRKKQGQRKRLPSEKSQARTERKAQEAARVLEMEASELAVQEAARTLEMVQEEMPKALEMKDSKAARASEQAKTPKLARVLELGAQEAARASGMAQEAARRSAQKSCWRKSRKN